MMRIAYFLDVPKGLGGAGNVLLRQAEIMSRKHEVIVVIPCDVNGIINEEYQARCVKKGLVFEGLLYKTSTDFCNVDIYAAYENMDAVLRFLENEKIDFVHSVQLNVTVELASRVLGISHLMNIYQLREREFKIAYGDIFAHFHSSDSILYCDRWRGEMRVSSRCIRPAAQKDSISYRYAYARDELRILMLGGVCERKNQLTAIKVVEKMLLSRVNVRLTIAGDVQSRYAAECQHYIEEKGLSGYVVMCGFCSDITALLMENDVFLCTSIDESFPSSIVEALTYDLAIVSTPVAGVPELMKDKFNAYISKDYSVLAIEDCLMDYLLDIENGNYDMVRENAHKTWSEHFSPDNIMKKLDSYYSDIMERDCLCLREQVKIGKLIGEKMQNALEYTESYIRNKAYYYNFLIQRNLKGRAYIWGAGKLGKEAKEVLELYFPEIDIVSYIDRSKIGKYCGIPVIWPEMMKFDEVDYIFVAFACGRFEVVDFLETNGWKHNEKVWFLP